MCKHKLSRSRPHLDELSRSTCWFEVEFMQKSYETETSHKAELAGHVYKEICQ